MNIFLKIMTIMLSLIAGLHAMDREANDHLPTEIKRLILTEVVKYNYVDLDFTNFLESVRPLRRVCQQWNGIINKDFMHEAMLLGCKQMCPESLNGKLIYRPNEESDEGMVEMRTSELWNPLGGTFDISKFGDMGKHLSISTGYRKGRRAENEYKVEIWFAPRFLIEKELSMTAKHFQGIYDSWTDKAPVGIIWTWGGWDDLTYMDYLTTQNLDEICNDNLYVKWRAGQATTGLEVNSGTYTLESCEKFHVHFMSATRGR